MKKIIVALCICLMAFTMVTVASAEELWDWHLRGADEGLAAGALPPPGLYFINDFYWTGNWKQYSNAGHAEPNIKLNGYVDIPILLWNPGICPILGATYAAAIAQPFDQSELRIAGGPNGNQWGAYNTVLIPFILSWEIPCNLHVAASFAIGLNDGTTSPSDSLAADPSSPFYHVYGNENGNGQGPGRLLNKDGGIYAYSSSDAYTFTPTLGISWLYAGWNISAEFQYTFWTKDSDCEIQNGDQLAMDYTATYTCGKWTFGLGAEGEQQVNNDKGFYLNTLTGNYVYGKVNNTMASNWTAGPIIGYNFGPCSMLFTYNFALSTKNDVGGDWAMLRLVVPLGNPYDWYK
ncbi:MAG: SphA family protein [Syntrophobacteraceae bacterium]